MAQNLCEYSNEKILEALEIISDVCSSNECNECPFGNRFGDCYLQGDGNPPEIWEIAKYEQTWRAFK